VVFDNLDDRSFPCSKDRGSIGDEEVDRMYADLRAQLIKEMRSHPDFVETGTYLLWAAHNIERVADRSTNIAENVEYQVTGKMGSQA